jgi:hypothetical protein
MTTLRELFLKTAKEIGFNESEFKDMIMELKMAGVGDEALDQATTDEMAQALNARIKIVYAHRLKHPQTLSHFQDAVARTAKTN